MRRLLLIFASAFLMIMSTQAQEILPRKVENPGICDMKGNPVKLPKWGEKNLLIFFVDPDSYLGGNSNKKFASEMEKNKLAAGDNIYGFGIVNTADTFLPKKLIRSIVSKRVEKESGAEAFDDREHIISKQWGLGDCNNKFAILIVSKEGELVYCHKEEFTEEDKAHFYEFVKAYR